MYLEIYIFGLPSLLYKNFASWTLTMLQGYCYTFVLRRNNSLGKPATESKDCASEYFFVLSCFTSPSSFIGAFIVSFYCSDISGQCCLNWVFWILSLPGPNVLPPTRKHQSGLKWIVSLLIFVWGCYPLISYLMFLPRERIRSLQNVHK